MTTIIDAIKMCEDKIKIHQNDTKNIEIAIGKKTEFVIINASNDEGNARYIKGKIKEQRFKTGFNIRYSNFFDIGTT